MSTRSAIARLTNTGPLTDTTPFTDTTALQWSGRYHHFDGYPSGLGRALWHLYHRHFRQDLNAMLEVLLDQHPAGWSTIVGADFTKEPGFQELLLSGGASDRGDGDDSDGDANTDEAASTDPCGATPHPAAPQCYCHGHRRERAWEVTPQNAAGSGCEYVYAFPPVSEQEPDRMLILASCVPGAKMVGMFGQGDPQAQWLLLAHVRLQEDEPDWEHLDALAWEVIDRMEV